MRRLARIPAAAFPAIRAVTPRERSCVTAAGFPHSALAGGEAGQEPADDRLGFAAIAYDRYGSLHLLAGDQVTVRMIESPQAPPVTQSWRCRSRFRPWPQRARSGQHFAADAHIVATALEEGCDAGLRCMHKAERYRALHAGKDPVLAGGCWDVGSAMMLAHAGLKLLETSSAGVMFARGLPDGDGLATREQMLENARSIAAAVELPVTADLENGFGISPDMVAETIRLAGETGIVGGSIEDTTGDRNDPILPLGLAVERVRAAVEAANRLPFPFALTARADQYMHNRPDLAGTIQRVQQFQEAGADMILVPGLTGRADIETLCHSVDCPVAVVVGSSGSSSRIWRRSWKTWRQAGHRRKFAGADRLYRAAERGARNGRTRHFRFRGRIDAIRRTERFVPQTLCWPVWAQ